MGRSGCGRGQHGTTASEAAPGGKGVFRWNVGRLAAKEDQTVVLHLVVRQSQPFDLAVNLHYAPVASGAKITVLEPNLTLKLEGPENVLFGKKQVYRLKVANTGTGNARGVEISLLPRGTGQTKPAVQAIGILPAGRERTVEVDLTPRDEGDLVIEVDATAEGGARAHLAEKIAVLKPALAVEIAAPGFQFVGKEITCQIVVTNPGTAAAEEVTLEAILPELVGYLSGTQEGLVAAEAGRVRWQLGQLAPAEPHAGSEMQHAGGRDRPDQGGIPRGGRSSGRWRGGGRDRRDCRPDAQSGRSIGADPRRHGDRVHTDGRESRQQGR